MRIAAVIIAGGRSSRMGQEKALLNLKGKPIIRWIIERLTPQADVLAINTNGNTVRFSSFDLPVLADEVAVGTPLAGVHAALRWAEALGVEAVITVPSDSPFLPTDLVARLKGGGAAVAASGGHTHNLTGFWPTSLFNRLENALNQDRRAGEGRHPVLSPGRIGGTPAFAGVKDYTGMRRVQDWVGLCHARIVQWPAQPYDPFFNVNTPGDLAEAERIAAEFNP